MTNTCHGALESLLFDRQDSTLVNIKLLRGDQPSMTKEDLCREVHSAITQVITGMAESHRDFPDRTGANSIDLAKLG